MREIGLKRHRFPPDVIRYAVWLYYRFTMSLRDVEDLLTERGIDVSYETVRCWTNKFGPAIAAKIREARGRGDSVLHLPNGAPRPRQMTETVWVGLSSRGQNLT